VISSARFLTEDHDQGVIVLDGAELFGPIPPNAGDIRRAFDAWTAAGGVVAPFVPAPPPPYALTKLTIISRMSDEQLAFFVPAMNAQPLRLQQAWLLAQEVSSDHPFFAELEAAMSAAWGTAEAQRILAR
jgi:hypothetical protein